MNLFHKKIQYRLFYSNNSGNGKFISVDKQYYVLRLSVISILFVLCVRDAFAQLPDNGFRDDPYNNNGYSSGSVSQGSQTILEVVKSINYLSEVRFFRILS